MDWEKIKKSYPEAYKNFLLFDKKVPNDHRELYNFFDSIGMFITINWLFEYSYNGFYEGSIYTRESYPDNIFTTNFYSTRYIAETEVFTRAFFILNKKLNKGT